MSTRIKIQGLTKQFQSQGGGVTTAVDNIDVTIEPGELFFLLGPSGCGKTTLLRMIAGFITPTQGKIYFGDRDMTNRPPNTRNTGMMFQSYALWPHMTVADNVGYGLKIRKVAATERKQRVSEALNAVRMNGLEDRRPTQLSGGQQQRVALARALVVRPDVMLLDEPLSNLDAKLRTEMRSEIRRVCRDFGLTGVYVTHDQKEALSMADRIAVMDQGRIEQVATPREAYTRPKSRFVADFLGETNMIEAKVVAHQGRMTEIETPVGRLNALTADGVQPESGTCSIRPEAITIAEGAGDAVNAVDGTIQNSVYLGEIAQYEVVVGQHNASLRVFEIHPDQPRMTGEQVRLVIQPSDVVLLGR